MMVEFLWGVVAGMPAWFLLGYWLRYKCCRAGRTCSGITEGSRR